MSSASPTNDNMDIFVDGRFIPSTSDKAIDVLDPSTEEIIGRIPAGSPADVDAAVAAAHRAQAAWAAISPRRRGEYLKGLRKALVRESEDLALLISREVGSPLDMSLDVQVNGAAEMLDSFADAVEEIDWEQSTGNSLVVREPAGVVGAIAPWNYPLYQIVAKLGAALAAGCTAVVKPSELAPLNAYRLARAAQEAQLPPGVLNVVMGAGDPVGEALVRHPLVDLVTFTGSTRAGQRIAELAAQAPKPAVLELGGKSAAIVLDDADLDQVIPQALADCYRNSGQVCSGRSRLLVPLHLSDLASELAAQAAQATRVDRAINPGDHIGPLISAAQRDRVRRFIRSGISEGARLIAGGELPPDGFERGYFVRPTVFDQVTNDMTIAREEIFGPVLCLLTYRTEDEAVSIANDSPYGLSGAVWSADKKHAISIARRLVTGEVYVNGGKFNINAPFGGVKKSGYGRELGPCGVLEFTRLKAIQT